MGRGWVLLPKRSHPSGPTPVRAHESTLFWAWAKRAAGPHGASPSWRTGLRAKPAKPGSTPGPPAHRDEHGRWRDSAAPSLAQRAGYRRISVLVGSFVPAAAPPLRTRGAPTSGAPHLSVELLRPQCTQTPVASHSQHHQGKRDVMVELVSLWRCDVVCGTYWSYFAAPSRVRRGRVTLESGIPCLLIRSSSDRAPAMFPAFSHARIVMLNALVFVATVKRGEAATTFSCSTATCHGRIRFLGAAPARSAAELDNSASISGLSSRRSSASDLF